MNYYDEEITLSEDDIRTSNNTKVERISSRGSNSDKRKSAGSARSQHPGGSMMNRTRQKTPIHNTLTDDDGLLQDIIDHDEDEEDSDIQMENNSVIKKENMQKQSFLRHSGLMRSNGLSDSARISTLNIAKALDVDTEHSETESEGSQLVKKGAIGHVANSEIPLSILPEKWQNLLLDSEVKELFPYILKYIPQIIEISYHLQPFLPEYVPGVGDVDAFLKVTEPPHLKLERYTEVQEHLHKLGLCFLDEPSGSQSEPSLLNIKLRSALTGNCKSTRAPSAQIVPFAKSTKDIDKWINDVEQVHMSQSVFDAQPRKDIENIIIDWPHSYVDTAGFVQEAYQSCIAEQNTLIGYVCVLCQQFAIEGPLESQADFLLSIQTLFALYLAANQAWE